MKASPWVTPQTWKQELKDEILAAVSRRQLNAEGIDRNATISVAVEKCSQLKRMVQPTLVPSYRWCLEAVVEAALANPPQTAERAWRDLARKRSLSQRGSRAQQEYAEYCIGFVLAWRQVCELAGK